MPAPDQDRPLPPGRDPGGRVAYLPPKAARARKLILRSQLGRGWIVAAALFGVVILAAGALFLARAGRPGAPWIRVAPVSSVADAAVTEVAGPAGADGQVVVALDNVGYHNSHQVRRWWVAHQDRIRPLWLPAYAPELNLIERVWRHLKDKLSNHRWWADLPALEQATGTFLDHLRAEFHRPGRGIRLVHNLCKVG